MDNWLRWSHNRWRIDSAQSLWFFILSYFDFGFWRLLHEINTSRNQEFELYYVNSKKNICVMSTRWILESLRFLQVTSLKLDLFVESAVKHYQQTRRQFSVVRTSIILNQILNLNESLIFWLFLTAHSTSCFSAISNWWPFQKEVFGNSVLRRPHFKTFNTRSLYKRHVL